MKSTLVLALNRILASFIALVSLSLLMGGCAKKQNQRVAAGAADAALVAAGQGEDGALAEDEEAETKTDKKKKVKPASLPELETGYAFEVLWSTGVGKGLGRRYAHKLRLTPAGERLYVADAYGYLAAINSKNGRVIWEEEVLFLEETKQKKKKRKKIAYLSAGPGLYKQTLFLGTTQAEVIALSAKNGQELWRTPLTSEILAPPVASKQLVFAQTSDGRLVALRLKDGTEVWSYDNPVPRLSLRGTATPVVYGDVVVTAFASGKIGVLDAENGELLCEKRIATPEGRSELERIVDSDHAPLILNGTIYAASYQGNVRAFRLDNCDILWEYQLGTVQGLSAGFSQIYMVTQDDRVVALNRNAGRPAWTNEVLRHRGLATPVAFHNYVLVGDRKGRLYAISQSEGELLAYHRLGKKGIHIPPVIQGQMIYVLDDVGRLNALRIVEQEKDQL